MTDIATRAQQLEEAACLLDQAAIILARLNEPSLTEVRAHLEGNPCGWEGRLARDIIDERLVTVRQELREQQA